MIVDLEIHSPISDSFRAQSLASRMDYDPGEKTTFRLRAEVPNMEEEWSVGLIVGPSGSGKSQLLQKAYAGWTDASRYEWHGTSFLDDFPESASVESVSRSLSAAGLSSVPAWMLPYHRLSNGQQQRAAMARALLDADYIVFDEFTSLLDRIVARTTCIAVAKAMRRAKKRLVVATCHYDVAEWLETDWVFDTATATLARGRLRRPEFFVSVHPASRKLWSLFASHHYLSGEISRSARCFVGVIHIGNELALCSFASFLPVTGYAGRWRDHRMVVLPEYQGAGIGSHFIDACFAIMADEDSKRRLTSVSSSLPLNLARQKSPNWRLMRLASRKAADTGERGGVRDSTIRLVRVKSHGFRLARPSAGALAGKPKESARSSSRLTTTWEWVRSDGGKDSPQ